MLHQLKYPHHEDMKCLGAHGFVELLTIHTDYILQRPINDPQKTIKNLQNPRKPNYIYRKTVETLGVLLPEVGLSQAGMLGRTGRCKSFDNSANGYARGEAVIGSVWKVGEDRSAVGKPRGRIGRGQGGNAFRSHALGLTGIGFA